MEQSIIHQLDLILPSLGLSSATGRELLGEALRLDVFSVVDKPVDMLILRELLNRLFLKKYDSGIFEPASTGRQEHGTADFAC